MSEAWEKWKKSQGDSRPWHLLSPDAKIQDQAKIEKRFDTCKACVHFTDVTTQCKVCSCFMKLKTTLLGAECPIGKWGKETNE